MKLLLILFSATLICTSLTAQERYLSLENPDRFKRIKIRANDEVRYKLKEEGIWNRATIRGFTYTHMVINDNDHIRIEDIKTLSVRRDSGVVKATAYTGNVLMLAGAGFLGIDVLNRAIGNHQPVVQTNVAIAAGTAVVTGWIIAKVFRRKRHRIGKKWQLEIREMEFAE